ncbi:MAG: tol-pal system-associated acyl-CoA thioesterase [Nevskiales bacterium]
MSEAFKWNLRVYYEDTDLSGVVYHANYLHFFERARTEWLRHLGFDQQRLLDELKLAFTVASLEVSFRRPARLDDELEISVVVIRSGRASMQLQQTMLLKQQPEIIIAELSCRVGCVDVEQFRPCALPEAINEEIKRVS